MPDHVAEGERIATAIAKAGISIYDSLASRPELFYPTRTLEAWLRHKLIGLNLNYPIKTRSKVLKSQAAAVLGYPVPDSFVKCQPRFPGQNFDTYVQKASNLQVWNEEVSPARRYVVVSVGSDHCVDAVRVINGTDLAALDTTGTLTIKYQACIISMPTGSRLGSTADTAHLGDIMSGRVQAATSAFDARQLLPIAEIFARLQPLIGRSFPNPGLDQERNRGAVLHGMIQTALGSDCYVDTGQFPDVPEQLLEVKLQTSPTIDLGLVLPSSEEPILSMPAVRHCDVRYAVVYADVDADEITLTNLILVRGEEFFSRFRQFGGLTKNSKRQIRLPNDFYESGLSKAE